MKKPLQINLYDVLGWQYYSFRNYFRSYTRTYQRTHYRLNTRIDYRIKRLP